MAITARGPTLPNCTRGNTKTSKSHSPKRIEPKTARLADGNTWMKLSFVRTPLLAFSLKRVDNAVTFTKSVKSKASILGSNGETSARHAYYHNTEISRNFFSKQGGPSTPGGGCWWKSHSSGPPGSLGDLAKTWRAASAANDRPIVACDQAKMLCLGKDRMRKDSGQFGNGFLFKEVF